MKAMQLVETGISRVLRCAKSPDPVPAADEVVVDVVAAALNRRRHPWVWTTPSVCPLPVTLGSDGAGVVSWAGAAVTSVAEGDEVVIYPTLNWGEGELFPGPDFDIVGGAPTDGTFAEKILIAARNVAPRPTRLTWEESAALPLSGLTAWRALFTCGRVGSGSSVLVTGAGGGVSSFLIQLSTAAGAHVVATTGSAEKARRAVALGAKAAVQYRDPDWPEAALRAAEGELDAVIDSYGGLTWSTTLPLLRRGGVLVSFGDTAGPEATVQLRERLLELAIDRRHLHGQPRGVPRLCSHMWSPLTWRPVVDSTFEVENLDAAAQRLSSPTRHGKVVLLVSSHAF